MQPVLAVVASAVGIAISFWVIHNFLRSISRSRSQNTLGAVLIAAGIWMLFFRAFAFAIPVLILGTGLLLPRNASKGEGSAARISRVRSAHLEMTLDHATGNIDGRILVGKHQGQILSHLALSELLQYRTEVQTDEESVNLLDTFLDGNHPGWRDEYAPPHSTQLSREEALKLLGLEAGASERGYSRGVSSAHQACSS